jgi:hypothetical protein
MHLATVAYDTPLMMVACPPKHVGVTLINTICHCELCVYLLVCLNSL